MFLEKLARLTANDGARKSINRRIYSVACSALLIGSTGLSSQALAMSLGQKKPGLQLPLNSELEGPDSDLSTAGSASDSSSTSSDSKTDTPAVEAKSNSKSSKPDLTPFKLGDDVAPAEPVKEGDSPTFKIQASESNLLPNGTAEGESLPSKSMKDEPKATAKAGKAKLGTSLSETASSVNAVPLALINDESEMQQKAEFLETSERKQIAALWDATLNRSPDIQFVVQKLVPTSDTGHATTILTRMLGGVLAGSIGAVGMIAPSQGTYAAQSFASQALGQLMGVVDDKAKKKAQLGQAELISLYQMVRNTSDKLVENYRLYKKNIVSLNRATTDFEELNNMKQQAMATADAAKQLDMEYTTRKAQRDIIAISDDVHRFRQGLIDMSGNDAVMKLDQSVQEELQNLGESPNSALAEKDKKDKSL
jgi:hypothetical protein